MADLRELAAELGLAKVRTHLQSGNLLFEFKNEPADIAEALESALRSRFGFDVPVIIRTATEMAAIAGEHPFGEEEDPTKLHVVFYAEPPSEHAIERVLARDISPDRVAVVGREAFVHHARGFHASRVNLEPLGLGTARNWRVVRALADLARDG